MYYRDIGFSIIFAFLLFAFPSFAFLSFAFLSFAFRFFHFAFPSFAFPSFAFLSFAFLSFASGFSILLSPALLSGFSIIAQPYNVSINTAELQIADPSFHLEVTKFSTISCRSILCKPMAPYCVLVTIL